MIAHRHGRIVVIAEDGRKPIRLAPRAKASVGDGGTVIAPSAREI